MNNKNLPAKVVKVPTKANNKCYQVLKKFKIQKLLAKMLDNN